MTLLKHQDNKAPSQAEIQDMLSGLNRQAGRTWFPSPTSEQAWQRGMENYLKWFKDRNITIHHDPRDETWKLGEAPQLSQAERRVKKIGG